MDSVNNETSVSLKDRVLRTISEKTVEIPIKFPKDIYLELKEYCNANSGDCFWLGISRLLNEHKFVSNEEFENGMNQLNSLIKICCDLEDRISNLESSVIKQKEDKVKIPHFGKEE